MTTTLPTQLEQIDPRVLQVHPLNARRNLGDLSGLAASIKAMGVVEPLVVVPVAGGHMVIAGHRRRAAGELAGLATVPCLIRDDLMAVEDIDRAEHVAAMLAENVHRQDLTPVEEAAAVQQMIDLGVTVEKVAARTGLTKAHVTRAAALAGVDTGTSDMVTDLGLTLEQAAIVVEYADDPDTSARIASGAANGPAAFTHAVGRAKQDRANREQLLAMREQLAGEGRTVVDTAEWYGPTNRRVISLYSPDGDALGREQHLSCPGSAVHLQLEYAGPVAIEVCTDWDANGHSGTPGRRPQVDERTPEEVEAERVQLEQEQEDDAAMAAANTVRREWLRDQLLARTRADKTVLRFAMREQLAGEGRTVVDTAEWYGPTNRRVISLYSPDGDALGREQHLSCPGSAVHLQLEYAGPVAIEVCTDWDANGHSGTPGRRPQVDERTPEEVEAERVQLEQEQEDDAAMAAANTVRREWLRDQLLARTRADKTVLRFAVEAVQQRAEVLTAWLEAYGIGDDITRTLGLRPPMADDDQAEDEKPAPGLTDGKRVPDSRLPLQLLAHIAGAIECSWPSDAHRLPDWSIKRGDRADLVDWLVFLKGEGYGLSSIEQRIVDAHHAAPAGGAS